jgi:cytoskeletal protein CcmA (bactofilin family)
MFRRREDGSEELINENEGATLVSSSTATAATPVSPNAPLIASAPSAPAAQPAPSFRPVPPQAAMVAASRSSMASAPSQPSPLSASEPARAPSAATPLSRPASKRVLTVGPDIQMKGEITSCDRVVIEGMVDATMRDVHTVELAETGSLKGTAEVEDAEISGSFEGDLVVRGKLTVYASGRVRGNVTYGEIEIQRGGQISGNIRNAADAKSGAASGQQKRAA